MREELALEAQECHAAHQVAAAAAGQAPRARRHGHALPLSRARPDRQPGDARAVRDAQQDHPRDPRMARRARLRRGRNAGAAVARRRRRLAAVHDPPQRARPRPVPAHLRRAVPEPADRRRHGERLRHGQGVPQRGHLAQALARVHDHRVHVRLLRLQRRRDRDRRNVPRRRAEGARAHDDQTQRRGHRPRQAVEAHHDARADPRTLRARLHGVHARAARRGARRADRPAGDLGGGRRRHLLGEDRVDDQPADPRVRLPARAVPDHAARTPSTRSWPNTSTR